MQDFWKKKEILLEIGWFGSDGDAISCSHAYSAKTEKIVYLFHLMLPYCNNDFIL